MECNISVLSSQDALVTTNPSNRSLRAFLARACYFASAVSRASQHNFYLLPITGDTFPKEIHEACCIELQDFAPQPELCLTQHDTRLKVLSAYHGDRSSPRITGSGRHLTRSVKKLESATASPFVCEDWLHCRFSRDPSFICFPTHTSITSRDYFSNL